MLDRGSPVYKGIDRDIKDLSDYMAYLREETERGFQLTARRQQSNIESLTSTMTSEFAARDTRISTAANAAAAAGSAAASAGSAASSAASAAAAAQSTANQAVTDLAAANQTIASLQRTISSLTKRIEDLERSI